MSASFDESVLEVFRSELGTQLAVLEKGILDLENGDQSEDSLDALLRAAHSIKGAARMLDIAPVVHVLHELEARFIELSKALLAPEQLDFEVLLRCADLLRELHGMAPDEVAALASGGDPRFERVADTLRRLGSTEPSAVPPPAEEPARGASRAAAPTTTPGTAPQGSSAGAPGANPVPSASAAAAGADRTLRLDADNLARLLGLAGEIVVESRGAAPVANGLHRLSRDLKRALRGTLRATPSDGSRSALGTGAGPISTHLRDIAERLDSLEELAEAHTTRSSRLSHALYHAVLECRMRPFQEGLPGLERKARDLAHRLGKKVRLQIRGSHTKVDREILNHLEGPLSHMLTNALDHGIESPEERRQVGKAEAGCIIIDAHHSNGMLFISVADDGRGVDLEALRAKVLEQKLIEAELLDSLGEPELLDFLFLPGFSTKGSVTDASGRGVGLDAVREAAHRLRGRVRATTRQGSGTRIELQLPVTLSLMRALLVDVSGELYALPLGRIQTTLRVPGTALVTVDGTAGVSHHDRHLAVVSAARLLELEASPVAAGPLELVVLDDGTREVALQVDRLIGEQEIVIHSLEGILGKTSGVAAGTILQDGAPAILLDVDDLTAAASEGLSEPRVVPAPEPPSPNEGEPPSRSRVRILLAEDSATVREVERQLLSAQGYEVTVAVDGAEAWSYLRRETFDVLVTDIDMPRMDGLTLIRKLRADPRLCNLPTVVVSYKDRDEDRTRGAEAGADLYLTKASFRDESLLRGIRELTRDVRKSHRTHR